MSLKWKRKIQFRKNGAEITMPAAIARHLKDQGVKEIEFIYDEGKIAISPA